ncbi:hypothetical protein [Fimbriiglobus ruber]|uniref:Uncharacterized protein n=1 Tax=Fimbriiglobus ruber TaxID=1908690 RepID=A0A225DEF6_9BACT|nr:hypothetical protein [Fimbriiglobus ruber]OWK36898.1 hypothetical protein FRUB_07950 [Fimbriiglobus ruber]
MDLRDPKSISLTDGDGRERPFILSKMPAFEGLEIMARYPTSLAMAAIPKLSEWPVVEDLQRKILKYVAVEINGKSVPLTTQALIDNHVGDWECLAKLLLAEVQYNNSFFRNGTISDFFADIMRTSLAKIQEILTPSSPPSSTPNSPPSTN